MLVVDEFPRPSRRKRLLVLALAVSTAVGVMFMLLERPGAPKVTRLPPPDAARCAAGQTTDCVGGMAGVIVPTPPAAQASAPPRL